jgi:hypothetical protein
VPVVLIEVEICAPLIVPAAAAPAPVTTEKARRVSPEPVEVKANRLYDRRVSPVVADVVANAALTFCAVVTERGEAEVPVSKPLLDTTGPENVVVAMIYSLHASWAYLSACRQPGLSDTPESPE